MKTCVIIAGGDVAEKIEIPQNALVICADCGYRHALQQGIEPDVLIGDFDSYTEPLPEHCKILKHPIEKDETDTVLAVYYGKEQGCKIFAIYGALGGERIDHSIANIQLLHHMHTMGLQGILHHGNTIMSVLSPEMGVGVYPYYEGSFSLFAMTDTCEGVTIKGTKYTAENITLKYSFALGVSNSIIDEFAEVQIQSGLLLVVQIRGK